jgi:hypothetical protein
LLLSIICSFFLATQAKQSEVEKARLPVIALPDIEVESMHVSSQPSNDPAKIVVLIDFTLFNNSSSSTICCPTVAGKAGWNEHPAANSLFNIRVDSRPYPGADSRS